mmetsp:Transcript_19903/g.29596  ORF Transcript_19903/g.29596 Transcript_19903/m.29596 type:complete len:485 (-) Transcript_19903:47-1501(-)
MMQKQSANRNIKRCRSSDATMTTSTAVVVEQLSTIAKQHPTIRDAEVVMNILAQQSMQTLPEIAQVGCTALWNLSSDGVVRAHIVQAGGIRLVLSIIDTYRQQQQQNQHKCSSSSSCSDSHSELDDDDAKSRDWVLFMASGVLCNLTYRDDQSVSVSDDSTQDTPTAHNTTQDEVLTAAIRGGICQFVTNLMKREQKNIQIQEKGCWMLWTISHEPEGREAICNGDACRDILRAMEYHMDVTSLQEQAAGALWNLSEDCELMLGTCEWVQCLLRAMRLHPESAGVARHACGALVHLVDDFTPHHLHEYDGVQDVTQAMISFPYDVILQEQACAILAQLATWGDREYRVALNDAFGIDAILYVMTQNMHPHVIHAGRGVCILHSSLSAMLSVMEGSRTDRSEQIATKQAFVRANGVPILSNVMVICSRYVAVRNLVSAILRYFDISAVSDSTRNLAGSIRVSSIRRVKRTSYRDAEGGDGRRRLQ